MSDINGVPSPPTQSTPPNGSLPPPPNGRVPPQSPPGSRYSPEAWAEFKEIVSNAMMVRQNLTRALMDPRRDIEDACGYPRLTEEVSIELYRQLYDRDAIGARVVECLPQESWQVTPNVYESQDSEDVTPFEEAWDSLGAGLQGAGLSWAASEKGSRVWEYLLRADVRSGIGRFGLILLGIDDGKALHEPADGVMVVGKTVEDVSEEEAEEDTDAEEPEEGEEDEDDAEDEDAESDTGDEIPSSDGESDEMETEEGDGDSSTNPPRDKKGVAVPVGKKPPPKGRPPIRKRVTNQYAPFIPDSPITTNVEEALKKLPGVTDEELRVIKQWGRERVQAIRNARFIEKEKERGERETPSAPSGRARDSQGREPMEEGDGPPEEGGLPPRKGGGREQSAPPGKGSGKAGRGGTGDRSPDLSGTDAQYYDASTGSSGGDQYYGVQFGDSEQPSPKPAREPRKLLFLRVFDESLVQIVRYEWNSRNPRFGLPVMYRITLNDPRDASTGVGLPLATVFVHWSRVIHVADNIGSSEFIGRPRMQQVLNHLLGLRKLYHGSPEMFWRGAFPGLALSTHPQLGGDVQVDETRMKSALENYFTDFQRYMLLTGMTAQTLAPQVADPSPHIIQQIEAICIKLGIPIRIFKGSERGELASSQDDAAWNDRLRHRQELYLTPRLIMPFVDRLICVGVLPEPEEYYVDWEDLESLGKSEKATIAGAMTTALGGYVSGGLEAVITPVDFLVRFLGFPEEEAVSMVQAAEQLAQKKAEEQAALQAQQPMIGPDGQPLPPGVGPDGQPLPPGEVPPQVDEEGNPIPPEVDAEGNPLPAVDEDGNPLEGEPPSTEENLIEPGEASADFDEDGNPLQVEDSPSKSRMTKKNEEE